MVGAAIRPTPLTRFAFVLIALVACTPASAHRACMRVGPDGKAAGGIPDVNSDLPEFEVVMETTFLPAGVRQRAVVGNGAPGYPICSMEECERFMAGMKLPAPRDTPRMSVRAFCVER